MKCPATFYTSFLMLLAIASFIVVGGCGGQSLEAPPDAQVPLPASERVLIIREKLPASVQYGGCRAYA